MGSTKLTDMESCGAAGGPMRNACGTKGSGLQLRNRFPPLPGSGVKKPAPVAAGICLPCVSSGGALLLGGGRGGNNSSISGIDPVRVNT